MTRFPVFVRTETTFLHWLRHRRVQDLGHTQARLTTRAIQDGLWPHSDRYSVAAQHLEALGADSAERRALRAAWEAWAQENPRTAARARCADRSSDDETMEREP